MNERPEPAGLQQASTRGAKKLRILAVGDHTTASTRYRVLNHLQRLRSAGFEIDLRLEGDPPRGALVRRLRRLRSLLLDTPGRTSEEILFLHRRTYPPPINRLLGRRRAPLIFDMDDALDLPPPGRDDPALNRRYRRNFVATAGPADLVICGNAELAGRVPHDRTTLIPTAVDCDRFAPDAIRPGENCAIGWVGHSDNLPFLENLAGVFRELAVRHPRIRLVVVADRPPRLPGLNVEFRRWRLEEEVSCFDFMDVGLMPLEDTPWTRSKCSFKLLQYMALGIPTVASPVGMNREVVEHGKHGFLARTAEDWFACLDRLLSDAELAHRFADRGRRVVSTRYSTEVVGPLLVEALRRVR